MAALEPDFKIRVWKYTFLEPGGSDVIILNSPQKSDTERDGTLVLRQTNSDAENKVWIQEQPSQSLAQYKPESEAEFFDDAHGVVLREGLAKVTSGPCTADKVHRYRRGDKVWVCGLAPSHNVTDDAKMIPVVDLQSLRTFDIPFDYICFVPGYKTTNDSGERHATIAGPVVNAFQGKKKMKARAYFVWPVKDVRDVSLLWLNKTEPNDVALMKSFRDMGSSDEKRQAFQRQWRALTAKLSGLGLLMGDDILDGDWDKSDPSSTGSTENLELQWKPSDSSDPCCNIDPCPSRFDRNIDLVPTFVGGFRPVEHYHVQDDDLDECPQGVGHKDHCILRDDRTKCAYIVGRTSHTCCKPKVDMDSTELPLRPH